MKHLKADYLVIGSGAVSMTFVDTMLQEDAEATFIMVDRHHLPGGHWNDAYPFVRLHQPSAFYGVASTDLGSNRIDTTGPNKGFLELASGPEVSAYFERVMREKLLTSGRVQYFPMHDYKGDHTFGAMLSDDMYKVTVGRRLVDGTYFNTSVPSMHTRKFTAEDGVTCVPPNDLPRLAGRFRHFTILGGGKTAMDAAVWLLEHGARPSAMTWVCPRASWLINRKGTQPGKAFFKQTVGGIANQFDAMIAATSPEDLFLRLEAAGVMMRIDPSITPTMFHYATISEGEAAQLARIKHVIRGQRVARLTRTGMAFESGQSVTADSAQTLYIDCTASAVIFENDRRTKPVFTHDAITLQAVLAPLVTYSAAIIARVEAQFADDAKKNMLCTPVRLADTPAEWMGSVSQNMINQNAWNQSPELRKWVTQCRLNPAAAAIAEDAIAAPENVAIMERIRQSAIPAVMNMQKLISQLA